MDGNVIALTAVITPSGTTEGNVAWKTDHFTEYKQNKLEYKLVFNLGKGERGAKENGILMNPQKTNVYKLTLQYITWLRVRIVQQTQREPTARNTKSPGHYVLIPGEHNSAILRKGKSQRPPEGGRPPSYKNNRNRHTNYKVARSQYSTAQCGVVL